MEAALEERISNCPYYYSYRFFGKRILLRSDNKELLESFDSVYSRFKVVRKAGEDFSIMHILPGDFDGHCPGIPQSNTVTVVSGGEIHCLEGTQSLSDALLHFVDVLCPQLQAYFWIHSAAVSRDRKAILLCSHRNLGKTTILLELVRRGCDFISDGVAVLGRRSYFLEPFPRGIAIEKPTLEILARVQPTLFKDLLASATERNVIDPGRIPGCRIGISCRVAHVVFLVARREEMRPRVKPPARHVSIGFSRYPHMPYEEIGKMNGVSAVKMDRTRAHFVLHIECDETRAEDIRNMCSAWQGHLLYMEEGLHEEPEFEGPPRMRTLPRREGVRRFQDMLFRSGNGKFSMRELTLAIQSAHFHAVCVGQLTKTTDLVSALVRD